MQSEGVFTTFGTFDEAWIHYHKPEMKEHSKQWASPGEASPKRAKPVPSAGKVMPTVFFLGGGILQTPSSQIIRRREGQ